MKNHKLLVLLSLLILIPPVNSHAIDSDDKELFSFINEERERSHLPPLIWDDELSEVAKEHSKDMADTETVSHTGSDGSQPHERIKRHGIFASRTAENIARDINVISAHTMLMQSLYHRENILNPEITHGAVSIVEKHQFLYITELFIEKLGNYRLENARQMLLKQFNSFREGEKLAPLILSESLSNVAQSHVDVQEKFGTNVQMLIAGILSKQRRSSMLINVYTTTDLHILPEQLRTDLKSGKTRIGIGFRRAQDGICNASCYLIVLIFG